MNVNRICLIYILTLAAPALAEPLDAEPIQLLKELAAVRAANRGKIISWKAEVFLSRTRTSKSVQSKFSRRIEFVFNAVTEDCRNTIRPVPQGPENPGEIPINQIALMRANGRFLTLVSSLRNSRGQHRLDYRPVEVFATLAEIPGNGDFFDPFERMDYNPVSEDPLVLLLTAIEKGMALDPQLFKLTKSDNLITLQSGDNTWTCDLNEGGLVTTFHGRPPTNDRWTASHVNVDGVWLPSEIHDTQEQGDTVARFDLIWRNHQINFPTAGEFTLAKLGAFRGLRLFDHIEDTYETLTGDELPAPPANLWAGYHDENPPPSASIRWSLWINVIVVALLAAVFLVRRLKRPSLS